MIRVATFRITDTDCESCHVSPQRGVIINEVVIEGDDGRMFPTMYLCVPCQSKIADALKPADEPV